MRDLINEVCGDTLTRCYKLTDLVGCLLLLGAVGTGCRDASLPDSTSPTVEATSPFQFSERETTDGSSVEPTAQAPAIRFVEVAPAIGLSHVYQNGEQGRSIMVETLGGGCGWLDYDGDGQWDLVINQGGDSTRAVDASQPADALFRNLGDAGFQEVSARAWFAEHGYGQGVAIGDFDNDGFDDVYITNVGANALWRNLGDGTFEEIGTVACVNDNRWSTSAAWADLDGDGDLDLYVCNYLKYDPQHPLDCRTKNGESRICHPKDLDAWPDECFINQGDGTFSPEAQQRGLFGNGNKALGVAIADFNNDTLPDIYVANDTTANFLFINQGAAMFQEVAYLAGCAVDRNGSFQASMGLGVSDLDRNGYLDIYITHFHEESNTLYENLGDQGFQDTTGLAGLHEVTMPYLGFGVVIADFDLNGRDEIFVTNGHIENYPGSPLRKMHPQLLANVGGKWHDLGAHAGDFFRGKYTGRGASWCDFDADGDVDLAVIHQNDPAAILRNESTTGNWLKLRFIGRTSNRRGIGCRAVVDAGGQKFMQELCGGLSYASTSQPALIFGLGEEDICNVDVLWPSGQRQQLKDVPVNRELVLREPE